MITDGDDITDIDLVLITDLSYLFEDETTFNQDISGWDSDSVINMGYMFSNASDFSQNISSWKDHIAETVAHENFSVNCPMPTAYHPYNIRDD